MVKLKQSESDGRSLCIHITDKGNTVIQNSKGLEEKVYKSFFKEFTEEEIHTYFSLTNKFSKGLGYLEKCFQELREKGEM